MCNLRTPVQFDPSFFTIAEGAVLERLGSGANGHSGESAARALHDAGPNTVAVGGRHSFVRDLLERCRNPLVIQLLIIAAVSYLMCDLRSTIVVGGMVFLSVVLSYVQEAR